MARSTYLNSEMLTTFPLTKYRNSALQVIGASLLITLFSQIKVVLPFTPIPLTFQTLAALFVGASLGSKKGAAAVLLYFAQVLIGLPVLAGGEIDPLRFFGPSGGYCLGFLLEAYCIGWFAERMNGFQPLKLFVGGILACALQLSLGCFHLASFVGWNSILMIGFFPFVFGEILKVITVCAYLKSRQNLS